MLYLQPSRTPGLLTAQAEYQARILPALAGQLRLETAHCGHTRPGTAGPEHAMTGTVLGQALGLRPPRLARLPLPARPEDPRHHARLPRRHHR